MPDALDDDRERDLAMVKRHAAQLAEHFDAVHIFVTRPSEDGTIVCNWGAGNWYARYGQVRAWIVAEEAKFGRPDDQD